MTAEDYKAACEQAFNELRERVVPNPNTRYKPGGSTGNLADNALQFRWEGENGLTFHVFVDENEAPYMVYTNEPWKSKKWKGKQNPNEGWWSKAHDFLTNRITELLNGELHDD